MAEAATSHWAPTASRCAHIDLEPLRNSLVAFPSWVPHEVRPIGVPSGDFGDYRFALNCWYCRALAPFPAEEAMAQ